jgi:hypothetical protein
MTPYHADMREIGLFVSALFRYAESGSYISLRAFDQFDRSAAPRIVPLRVNGSLDAVIRSATIVAENAAQSDIPLVFCPPIATFSGAGHAAVRDLANGLTLSVELDDGDPDEARLRLEAVLGPVTVVVRSGSDWTDRVTGEIKPRVHLHWRLNEPTTCVDDHERLRVARSLASLLVGADPTANAVVHPLRWPGSWNFKIASRPRMASIAVLNDGAEVDLGDALESLEAAVEAAGLAKAAEMPAASSTPEARIADVRSAMLAIPNPGRGEADEVGYADWVRLGIAVRRATGGGPDGFSVWHDWSALSDKYDLDETVATWRRILSSTSGAPPPRTAGAGTIFFRALAAGWVRPFPFATKAGLPDDDTDVTGVTGVTGRPARARILSMRELDALPPPGWLVEGLIPETGLVIPFGPPKSGKSFLVMSFCLHIADGRDWFGMPVKQGAVVYIAGEGVGGMSIRLRAMRLRYDIPVDAPMWIVPRAVNFQLKDEVDALIKLIRETVGTWPVAAVVIDTLARAMPGADENSAQEVGLVIAACDRVRDEFGCAVVPVHHTGKDIARGARGTSALRGALDTALEITGRGKRATMTVADQKEAEGGQRFIFRMEKIAVGVKHSSLVPMLESGFVAVNPDDADDAEVLGLPGGATGEALDTLRKLMADPRSVILPPLSGLPSGNVRGIAVDVWQKEFYLIRPEYSPGANKTAFSRARHNLLKSRRIGVREPWVWLC